MNRNETILLNRRFEVKYFPKVQRAIKSQISSLIEVIESRGVDAGLREAQLIISSPVAPVVQKLYLEVGLRYARRTWRQLLEQKRRATRNTGRKAESERYGRMKDSSKELLPIPDSAEFSVKGFGFNATWVQFIQDFLFRFLLEKIVFQVSETTREVLLNVLNKSIEEGWGVDKTVRELEELPLSKTQAARIVRTEVTRAANTGAMAAGSTFEFEQTKEWIAANDRRTRGQNPNDHASHIGLDGITIDYEDEFTDPINGDKLRYPGDPKASAASTINCRCSIAVVAKTDERGRLIPKKIKANGSR